MLLGGLGGLGGLGCSGDEPTTFDDAGPDSTTTFDTAILDTGPRVDALPEADAVDETDADAGEADVVTDASDVNETETKTCLPALSATAKGVCDNVTELWTDEGALHFEPGTTLTYCTRPPSSGDHYGSWAAFRVYDKPVPYGYLVHSLEHGAVVILYKCASGSCPAIQSQLVAVAEARPVDPLCIAPIKRRIIIAPDPGLDIEIGASAWRWTYRASCVNAASLGKFIDDHYAKTAEDFCSDGVIPP